MHLLLTYDMSSSRSSPASRSVTEFQSGDGVNDLARCFTCLRMRCRLRSSPYAAAHRIRFIPHLNREEAPVTAVSVLNQDAIGTLVGRHRSFQRQPDVIVDSLLVGSRPVRYISQSLRPDYYANEEKDREGGWKEKLEKIYISASRRRSRRIKNGVIRLSPRGFGIPLTRKDILTSSPTVTSIDFLLGLETNIAGFPPSITDDGITSTVAHVSTCP